MSFDESGPGDYRIGFLVYASRSGSTLLSQSIVEHMVGVHVTSELKFDGLFELSPQRLRALSHADLVERVTRKGSLRNLHADTDQIASALDDAERDHRSILETLLNIHLTNSTDDPPSLVLIKQGVHTFHWRRIRSTIPGALFLFVRRDPRAVVSSKLRTPRPYYPREVMAWAGAALDAWHWCRYEHAMASAQASGVAVFSLRYEDLLEQPSIHLGALAERLDVRFDPQGNAGVGYVVPDAERSIHQLVDSGQFVLSRRDAWRSELTARELAEIESVAAGWMVRSGYRPVRSRSTIARLVRIGWAVPDAALRILRHLMYHARRAE